MSETKSSSDAWLETLKTKLEKDKKWTPFLDQLRSCKNNHERMAALLKLGITDDIVSDVDGSPWAKDDSESVKYREAGNQLFQKKQFVKALKQYNRSVMLASAQGDTATLALAFANRSAVLYHLKFYENCLLDIESAQQYGYPDKLKYKLLDRKGKCCYKLGDVKPAEEAFQAAKAALHSSDLDKNKINNWMNDCEKQVHQCQKFEESSGAGKTGKVLLRNQLPKINGIRKEGVLNISSALEIGTSQYSGRGLYANRDIEVGEVLIIEKPYASTVLQSLKNTYCHHCCSRLVSPLPCISCSGVAFCSDECRTEACDRYHQYECSILHKVAKADISLGNLALKMVLKAGPETLGGYTETEDEALTKTHVLKGGYDSDDYKCVYDLVNHAEDRKLEDLVSYMLQAVFLMKCAEDGNFLGEEKGVVEERRVSVGAHLLRNLMMLPCNAHECSELLYKDGNLPESVTVEVGSAIYPCLSLINHSCDPNVVRHSYKNVCVVRAIRNIPKDGEILDNYGALCALTSMADRRKKLEDQYFFLCKCEACTDDYPQYLQLPTETPVFKCDKCKGPVFLPMKGGYENVPCSFCKHGHSITPRIGKLGQSDEAYRSAMMEVLTSSLKNIDENIVSLEEHLQLMDRVLCRPWRDYNDCQEALKQCYACKANNFPARLA